MKSKWPSAIEYAESSAHPLPQLLTPVTPKLFLHAGLDDGLLLPAVEVPRPNSDGKTQFSFSAADGSVFVAELGFSGPGGVISWGAFNPQPDPPGDWAGFEVGFRGDASVSLQLWENGQPLTFAVPEPSAWALIVLGFLAMGFFAHRRAESKRVLAA